MFRLNLLPFWTENNNRAWCICVTSVIDVHAVFSSCIAKHRCLAIRSPDPWPLVLLACTHGRAERTDVPSLPLVMCCASLYTLYRLESCKPSCCPLRWSYINLVTNTIEITFKLMFTTVHTFHESNVSSNREVYCDLLFPSVDCFDVREWLLTLSTPAGVNLGPTSSTL